MKTASYPPPPPLTNMEHKRDVKRALISFIRDLEQLGYVVTSYGYTINPMSSKEHEGTISVSFNKPKMNQPSVDCSTNG